MTIHRRGYRRRRNQGSGNPVPVEALLLAWVLTDMSLAGIALAMGFTRETLRRLLLEARDTGDGRVELGYAMRGKGPR